MRKGRLLGWACVWVAMAVGTPVQATVWNEAGDAGGLPGTADIVAGSGALNQINGVVPGPNDIDMYQIRITDPAAFSASGTGGLPFGPPRLFLFDASGVGVTGYIDSTNSGAALSATHVNSPGLYYLAYSASALPIGAGNPAQLIWQSTPSDIERAPDGPGAAGAVAFWSPTILPLAPTNYTINLTGAAFVPEPVSGVLLLGGFVGVMCVRRRSQTSDRV